MAYSVKESFLTLQGEGANAGRAAVFCRFAGCNLWSGREEDRYSALCTFCDTDFVGTNGSGGGVFSDADALAQAIAAYWPSAMHGLPMVVFTGGEPLLQLDEPLIRALHARAFKVAVETNGTLAVPNSVDWICVSPKAGTSLSQTSGNELKLVFPQPLAPPERFELLPFENFFIQPMDGPMREMNTAAAVEYCLKHPKWRLSLQTHKLLGIR